MNLPKLNLVKLIPIKLSQIKSTLETIPLNERIMNKMTVIEHHCMCATNEQFELFRQTVVDLINGPGRNIGEAVESIVSDIAARMRAVCADLVELTHNYVSEVRETQVETLKDGLIRLEALQPAASTKHQTFRQAEIRKRNEDNAIQYDDVHFRKSIAFLKLVSAAQSLEKVLVFNMLKPEEDALRLSAEDFPTCNIIRMHLRVLSKAKNPDIWIRHHRKHKLTPGGFLWEWLPAASDKQVRGMYLEFIDRWSDCGYIVALKYVRAEMEESPTPLELVTLGADCCLKKCNTLQAHLHSMWSRYKVTKARRIHDGHNVLTEAFDNNLFDARTNNLFLELIPRPVSS